MGAGFKKLPFDWRDRVLKELQGAKLAVWLAHYWRSDKDENVEMSNSQIMRETNLSHNTVDIAKRWLKDNGWLVVDKAAYRDPITQQWIVAKFKTTVPNPDFGVEEPYTDNRGTPDNRGTDQPRILGYGTSPDNRGAEHQPRKSGSSVDTLLSLPVDTLDSDTEKNIQCLRIDTKAKAKASASVSPPHFLTSDESREMEFIHNCLNPSSQDDFTRTDNMDLLRTIDIPDPVSFANKMVWAYNSNSYGSCSKYPLNGLESFLKRLPKISKSYAKYYDQPEYMDGTKELPEEKFPTLEAVAEFTEKILLNRRDDSDLSTIPCQVVDRGDGVMIEVPEEKVSVKHIEIDEL
jgi:hypothetical protein